MKIKTSELTGAALDWAVLEVLKRLTKNPERANIGKFGPLFGKGYLYPAWGLTKFAPSTDWSKAGPIIERERIYVYPHPDQATWLAALKGTAFHTESSTPLIAAMRCFVSSRLGEEVDVPEELA